MKQYRLKKLNPRTWEVYNLSGSFIGEIIKDNTNNQVMWSIGSGKLFKNKKQAAEMLLCNK